MRVNGLTFRIFLLIILTDIGESLASLFMKKGLVRVGIDHVTLNNFWEFLYRNCSIYLVWLGVLIYILSFFVWIIVLARVDLSIALPIGSTSYIFVPILSMIFLHEKVGGLRWAGIALIVSGIYFVSKSKQVRKEGLV